MTTDEPFLREDSGNFPYSRYADSSILLKLGHDSSLPDFSHSLFAIHPTIRRYNVRY
jgi:hypothetical protein